MYSSLISVSVIRTLPKKYESPSREWRKPLVQLNGMAMIDRLIHIFAKNGAEEVVVIINNEVALTKEQIGRAHV